MLAWAENFIVPALFFTIPFLIIILIKLGYKLSGKTVSYTLPESSSKYGYLLLGIALILCVLTILPIAGQGFDTPFFVFRADHIHTYGLQEIFQTDRPLTYLLTEIITVTFNVPGRISIPISSVAFTTLFTFSVFVLTLVLTKNTILSSIASLFTVGSNIIRLTALCFVGNMLGFAFVYLFFATILKFRQTGKKLYFGLSTLMLICTFFSHFTSALFAVIILIFFLFYLLITHENRQNLRRLGIFILMCTVAFIFLLVSYSEDLAILISLFRFGTVFGKTGFFLQYMMFDWSSDYIWIFTFSIIGSFIVLFECNTSKKFLTAWVLAIVTLLLFSSTESSRILLFLPFTILASIGIYSIIDKYLYHYKKIFFTLTILFLISVPVLYSFNMRHMNIKYFEEGPFPWDTKYLETEQLKWIKHNYNTSSIVVLTDIPWCPSEEQLSPRGLIPGVHYRLLAEVGNNVYFGNLTNLLLEKTDTRGHERVILGTYSSINIDWTLQNKTILIPTTIYELSESEKQICFEVNKGVYTVKMEEVSNWLKNG